MRKKVLIALLFVSVMGVNTINASFAEGQDISSTNKGMAQKHFRSALALSLAGYLDRAMQEYNKAINIDPYFSLAYNNLGYIYRQKGKVDLAIECYNKSLTIKPDDTAYTNLASCYDSKGDFDKAVEMFNKALELDPGSITVELALEKVLKKKAKLEGKTYEELEYEMANKYGSSNGNKSKYSDYAHLLKEDNKKQTPDIVITSTSAKIKTTDNQEKNIKSKPVDLKEVKAKTTTITEIPVVKNKTTTLIPDKTKQKDTSKTVTKNTTEQEKLNNTKKPTPSMTADLALNDKNKAEQKKNTQTSTNKTQVLNNTTKTVDKAALSQSKQKKSTGEVSTKSQTQNSNTTVSNKPLVKETGTQVKSSSNNVVSTSTQKSINTQKAVSKTEPAKMKNTDNASKKTLPISENTTNKESKGSTSKNNPLESMLKDPKVGNLMLMYKE